MSARTSKARSVKKKPGKSRAGSRSGPRAKPTRKRLSAAERKAQIVAAATRLFSKKGFKGTTTREVAAAAGISEATIFKHFSTKESLYRAIIDRCCNDEEGGSMLNKAVEGKEGREFLTSFAAFIFARYREDPSFARLLLFGALEERKFSDIFMKSKGTETFKHIADHVRKLTRSGHFRDVDPDLAARAFMGMVLHYAMLQEIFGFKRFFDRPADEVASAFVDIYLNGISVGRSK